MSLLCSADVFKSIELRASQLFRGELICPHEPGERCSATEHLTFSEAKEAAARHAADVALRDAVWRSVERYAHSDVPGTAQRGQLLALSFVTPCLRKTAAKVSRTLYVDMADVRSAMIYGALCGLAVAGVGDDVREGLVRAANSAGWAVERADPAERTTDPYALVDRKREHSDHHELARDESDIQIVEEADPAMRQRINGESLGATLHGMGLLEDFLSGDPERTSPEEPV
ncbi:hypothetical protein GO001_14070 [Streptomyces sp. NRRL B-1677]|uniref:hypothetical protein n=1 Tax=Streptomyces sp. NRRL B-1677 TaxID=2682966 RepID=UPI001892CFE2|nr:hypothetical protein [Streptomyces sp. NRRL B-1677]MBF6046339.1 hypothetical protein [Streptomyces sp. NRRL B-1677]